MAGPLIRLGDKTSHGGVVIEASPHSDNGCIGIARMGDKTVCLPEAWPGSHHQWRHDLDC